MDMPIDFRQFFINKPLDLTSVVPVLPQYTMLEAYAGQGVGYATTTRAFAAEMELRPTNAAVNAANQSIIGELPISLLFDTTGIWTPLTIESMMAIAEPMAEKNNVYTLQNHIRSI